jgi:hypothetical protein
MRDEPEGGLEASVLAAAHPYMLFDDVLHRRINGGVTVHKWQ